MWSRPVSERFRRAFALTLGTETKIEDLRVSFRVVRTLRKEPNTADISIWNLSEKTRSALQNRGMTILLEAGYQDDLKSLYLGDLSKVSHRHEGPDWISTIQSGDGLNLDATRILKSFGKGTAVKDALKGILTELGAAGEQALAAVRRGDLEGAEEQLINGIALAGPSPEMIQKLAAGAGLEFSIQDGQVQLLDKGKATTDEAVVLATTTGLIGSPQPGEKGIVRARSLLNGAIRPAGRVVIDSSLIDGIFRVEKVEHSGDNFGGDWYTDIEAKPLDTASGIAIDEALPLAAVEGFA